MSLCKQNNKQPNLVLGDYVAVQVTGIDEDQRDTDFPRDSLLQHKAFFQRILKQRGKPSVEFNKRDSVINVRDRNREVLQNTSPRSKAG